MKKIAALGLLSVLLTSCNFNTDYKTVRIKNMYSIDLPDYMSEARNLNSEASLQYQNTMRELYTIVLDEPKTNFPAPEATDLEVYKDILKEGLETNLKNPTFSPIRDTVINGLKAKLFSLTDNSDGINIYYRFAYLESRHHFYQILTWTLENRKDQFSSEMNAIIASFKETESRGK